MNIKLYFWQRLTATLMGPLVFAHLFVIFYASVNGLSAAEVLGRTRGSVGWGLFYTLFVMLAAVHAAIGMRVVAAEWTMLTGRALDVAMWGLGLLLLVLGLRAVIAVVMP